MDTDFTNHYSLLLFVPFSSSCSCKGIEPVLCCTWASFQHRVIISTVKITFNLIIHLCCQLWLLYGTSHSHFAKITNPKRSCINKKDMDVTNNCSWAIRFIRHPGTVKRRPTYHLYSIKRCFMVSTKMSFTTSVCFSCFVCSTLFFTPTVFILSGSVLELQTEYFWGDEEDFSGSHALSVLWERLFKAWCLK